MKTCNNCGAALTPGDAFCPKCGAKAVEPPKPVCPNCRAETAVGASFCNKCGWKLGGGAAAKDTHKVPITPDIDDVGEDGDTDIPWGGYTPKPRPTPPAPPVPPPKSIFQESLVKKEPHSATKTYIKGDDGDDTNIPFDFGKRGEYPTPVPAPPTPQPIAHNQLTLKIVIAAVVAVVVIIGIILLTNMRDGRYDTVTVSQPTTPEPPPPQPQYQPPEPPPQVQPKPAPSPKQEQQPQPQPPAPTPPPKPQPVPTPPTPAVNASTFTDNRDGKKYKTVVIGGKRWMAENLNYQTSSGSWCYKNDNSNCGKYGRLYEWNTAKTACPSGYHLPSRQEWQSLVDYAGGKDNAGKKLKARSGWNNNGNGTDDFGFSALPGGRRNADGSFNYVGYRGDWWTTTEYGSGYAYSRNMYYDIDNVDEYYGDKGDGFSLRCVAD